VSTDLVFRTDAYARSCTAKVIAVEDKGIVLDRTVFYATSGGQPGDTGTITTGDGTQHIVSTAVFTDPAKTVIAHVVAPGAALTLGETVTCTIDWEPRYRRMRMHSALHLLSVVLPYPVTGGAIGTEDSRLDFDIPDAGLDKEAVTAKLAELIGKNADITDRWITDAELDANPGLVKTMSVQPPRGAGKIRLVSIEGLDLQPCGGTHVRNTSEIGAIVVTQIEKKGKQNRRVRIAFG
jgi:misacylated tRNA(Ala) deacylase